MTVRWSVAHFARGHFDVSKLTTKKLMDSSNRLQHIIDSLIKFRKLWLLPAILGLLASTAYAFFLQGESWTARQTMIIRDDLLGQHFKPGSFVSEEAMKSAQETVLETARRPEVIRNTLEKLGPNRSSLFGLGSIASSFPSDQDVEDCREAVSFESANGGEIGKSEVIVLAAKSSSPDRAVEFLKILLEEVDSKLSEVQGARFQSMESELKATFDNAELSTEALQGELMELESKIGSENINLVRSMTERSGGGSPSAFENQKGLIESERRLAQDQLEEAKSIKRALKKAFESNLEEVPTSAELLANQPVLSEMVTSLAKAREELSEQEAEFTSRHYKVEKARDKVGLLQKKIKRFLVTAARGIENRIKTLDERVKLKELELKRHNDRLKNISGYRVRYEALTRRLQQHTEESSKAGTQLANMQSRKDASNSIKLLTRIGEPWIGTRPDGLGKRVLALAGGIAGLMIGLGLVMIVAPPFEDAEPASAHPRRPSPEDETVSEQRLSQQLGDYRPNRQPAPPESKQIEPDPPTPPQAPVTQPMFEQPPVAAPPVATPPVTPETPETQEAVGVVNLAASTVSTTDSALADAINSTIGQETAAPSVTESGFHNVAPVNLSPVPEPAPTIPTPPAATTPTIPVSDLPEPRMMAAPTPAPSAEEAYLNPTVQTEAPPVQFPPEKPVEPAAPTPQPPARPASQTLAAIFANMPQPRTDIDDQVAADQLREPESTGEIADRILDVAGQSASSTKLRDPEDSAVREPVATIQLDQDNIATGDAIPLQRRATYRPVEDSDAENPIQTGQDGSLSEESIDSVFSQLQQPGGQHSSAPPASYDNS